MGFNLIPFDKKQKNLVDHFGASYEYRKGEYLRVDLYFTGEPLHFDGFKNIQAEMMIDLEESLRKDELWRSTCFEFFIKSKNSKSYYEFNVTPQLEWNFYSFESEREGMKKVECEPGVFCTHQSFEEDYYLISIMIDLINLPIEEPFFLSPVAILSKQGECSYWAMAHKSENPDFHAGWNFTHLVREEN